MKPAKSLKPCLFIFFCIGITNTYAQSISGVVNSYYQVTAVNSATNTVTVSDATGLTANTRVLLIQMKGAAINSANSSSYGNITAINNAGNYEINTICSVSGNDVLLQYQMLNSYTAGASVQLVTVPSYKSVTVSDTIKASAWNTSSGTGGIVAIEATDTIYLNSGIDVSGQGFAGGALFNYAAPTYDCSILQNVTAYYFSIAGTKYQNGGEKGEGITDYIVNEETGRGKLANGGGGGDSENTGGGGGGNYGTGGLGGQSNANCPNTSVGVGGLSLSSYGYSVASNRIFLGGGGGSGHENNAVGLPGGNGGGIVLLSANVITASGTSISANGGRPYNAALTDPYQASGDGAGGGGAGGTVLINASINGSLNIYANGAIGGNSSYPFANSCMGPGGGGAGGVIWVAGSSFPASISASVSGGANGVISPQNTFGCAGQSNNATAGSNGIAQPNYVLQQGMAQICVQLPLPELRLFSGILMANGSVLNWQMNNVNDVDNYEIESSTDRLLYNTVAVIKNNNELNLSFTDNRVIDGTVYYRLRIIKKDGTSYYSQMVALTRNINGSVQFVSLRPNPVNDNLTVVLYAKNALKADVLIYNSYGQHIMSLSNSCSVGYNKISLGVSGLAQGIYYVKTIGTDFSVIRSFVKH
ncbi:MAG TPA: T9SS type A sorting domain-containing protein [Puia sp.]|nr:T9SS type A sorting domain-containing protein [Puia sp.]